MLEPTRKSYTDRFLEGAALLKPIKLMIRFSVLLAGTLASALLVIAFLISPSDGIAVDAEQAAATAEAEEPVVADVHSICEAQRLKADLEDEGIDPKTAGIPAEFDRQWPSLSACDSHDAAWDEDTPGPIQPIPFSHRHHAGTLDDGGYEIDCFYCHSNTERSQAAGVPSVQICMGCHKSFPAEFDELEGIRILRSKWQTYVDIENKDVEDPILDWTPGGRWVDRPDDEKQTIEWIQVHRLPEHVQFRHNRHFMADKVCQDCHGQVEKMDKVYLVPDMRFVNGMPARKMEMGWCVDCHRENKAVVDCLTCHY